MRSVTVASHSSSSKAMSKTSRWPTSRSASPTPWCVYSERPVTSIETAGEDGPRSSSRSSSSISSKSSSGSLSHIQPESSSGHREGIGVLGDVVHAEHRRAALEREHVRGDRARHAVVPVAAAGQLGQEALAGGPDHDGPPDRNDLVEPAQQLEVVLDRLAEADAGVEPDAALVHALRYGEGEALLEERPDVRDHVVVARVVLHRARLAEHVHEAAVDARAGHDARQLR